MHSTASDEGLCKSNSSKQQMENFTQCVFVKNLFIESGERMLHIILFQTADKLCARSIIDKIDDTLYRDIK